MSENDGYAKPVVVVLICYFSNFKHRIDQVCWRLCISEHVIGTEM